MSELARELRERVAAFDKDIRWLTRRRDDLLSQIRHDEYEPPVSNEEYIRVMATGGIQAARDRIIVGALEDGIHVEMAPPKFWGFGTDERTPAVNPLTEGGLDL